MLDVFSDEGIPSSCLHLFGAASITILMTFSTAWQCLRKQIKDSSDVNAENKHPSIASDEKILAVRELLISVEIQQIKS